MGMWSDLRRARRVAVLGASVVLVGAGFAGATAAEGVFAGFAGSWSGTGTVSVSNGSNERIRCRATYSVAPSGEQLHQELRCASDSYKFEVNSNVIAAADGSLSGSWTELTRQVTGAVTGRVSAGAISTQVKGPTFGAALSVQTKGNRQAVSIRPDSGATEITSISIDMKRT